MNPTCTRPTPQLFTLDELATDARRARDLLAGAAALLARPSYPANDTGALAELVNEARAITDGAVATIEGLIARTAEMERDRQKIADAQAPKHITSAEVR